MSQQELLKSVVKILEKRGITYMITGSLATSLQGEPRSTHDIDIVISLQKSEVPELFNAFPQSRFYLDKESMLEAVDNKQMFNLIDTKTGGKVDFWLFRNDPFDRSRFSRRISEEFRDMNIQVSSPEDTILAKLRWTNLSGGSEKHFTDALRVYEVQSGKLDLEYINKWTEKMNTDSLWRRVKSRAKEG